MPTRRAATSTTVSVLEATDPRGPRPGRRSSGVMRSLIGEPAEDTSYRHVDGVRPRRRRERNLRRRRRSARRSSSRTRSRAVVSCGGAYAFRPGRAVATRRWSGQMPPRQCNGDARREACAGRCMKSSTSSLSSRGEKWRLHQISGPTSSLAPEYCSNDAWRCERPRRRRRRPVDALLPRGSFTSRSKLSVVCRSSSFSRP